MKVIRVGDPHTQVSNLEDSRKLMDFVIKTAKEREVKQIEFLGDLFHTHAVKRIEVESFWQKTFNRLAEEKLSCIVLVGNHDQHGSKEKEQEINSLNIFIPDHNIINEDDWAVSRVIVNKPMILGGIGYIPYYSNHEVFIKACKELYEKGATELLVAHQTFTGAQYENGFFSEEGVDPELIPQKQIISGHIHKSQQVGKCFYPGTPKWDTMSDANQPKGIWIFTHEENGVYTEKEFISTEHIVTPINLIEIKEGDDLPTLKEGARNYVVLEGSSTWITKTKKKIGSKANIKVKPTDRIKVVNPENSVSIEKYLETEFIPIPEISKEDIKAFLKGIQNE